MGEGVIYVEPDDAAGWRAVSGGSTAALSGAGGACDAIEQAQFAFPRGLVVVRGGADVESPRATVLSRTSQRMRESRALMAEVAELCRSSRERILLTQHLLATRRSTGGETRADS